MGESRGRVARLALALGGAAVLLAVAFAAAYAGLASCHPAALPGDEGWMRGYLARAALKLLAGGEATGCVDAASGAARLALARGLVRMAVVLPVAALLWEAAGWRLRLWVLARRGGHAVLAGPVAAVAPLAGGLARVWLEPGGRADSALARHVVPMAPVLEGGMAAARLGLGRAGLVVAATGDDLANFRLARLALAQGLAGRLVVRLEGRGLRSLAADALREEAGVGAEVVIAAPSVVQAREALSLAMPGRYVDEAAGGAVHLALCGDGPQLEAMALAIARQGWGLERAVPHLSILRVGGGVPLPIESLPWVGEVLDLSLREVPDDDPVSIDAAMAAMATRGARLAAVFCVSETAGTASLLAGRWQRVFADLGRAVPPLVALEAGSTGDAGLVRVAGRPDLAMVGARQERLDARARAVHAHYLALVGSMGAQNLPARRPWEILAERYREDSRAAADHVGYKLALCGMVARPLAGGAGSGMTAREVALLAPVEHARWLAARRVAGWTPGPRDDAALRHPDLVPFDALDAAAQAKDADQVARLPEVLATGGEGLCREWTLRAGAGGLPTDRVAALLPGAIARVAARSPGHVVVLRATLAPRDIILARAALAAGALVELVLTDADGVAALAPEAVLLRRQAHRQRVVADPGPVMAATPSLMSDNGEEHGLARA